LSRRKIKKNPKPKKQQKPRLNFQKPNALDNLHALGKIDGYLTAINDISRYIKTIEEKSDPETVMAVKTLLEPLVKAMNAKVNKK